jgi:hypothetical protein
MIDDKSKRDTALAIDACWVILDGRDTVRDMAEILVTAEHTVAALLLLLMHDPLKAEAMLREALAPGIENRILVYASQEPKP